MQAHSWFEDWIDLHKLMLMVDHSSLDFGEGGILQLNMLLTVVGS